MLFRLLVHFAHLLCINAGGLFHHNMYSPPHTLNCVFRMIIVRHAYHTGVYKPAVKHFFCCFKAMNIGRQLTFCPFKSLRFNIRYGNKLKIGAFTADNVLCVGRTHVAYTYNSQFDFFTHDRSPLYQNFAQGAYRRRERLFGGGIFVNLAHNAFIVLFFKVFQSRKYRKVRLYRYAVAAVPYIIA